MPKQTRQKIPASDLPVQPCGSNALPHHLQRVLSPNEVDVTLAQGDATVHQLKAASAMPLVHHVPRQSGFRGTHGLMHPCATPVASVNLGRRC